MSSRLFYEEENAGGNAQAQLKFINTEEGRVVMTGSTPEYQYHMKDHLGNVRVTFTTVEQVENFVATVEDANADQEEGEFLNYADATKVRSKLFDNTHRDDQNQMMRATSVTDDQGKETKAEIATRLSGIGRERYGLAKSLRVMPGDVIRMEVYAKYTDPAKKNWVAGFEGALSEATVTAPATVVDGAMRNAAAASSALPVGALLTKPAGGVAPKAYLNYVMYDNIFVPITDAEQTNFVQVTEAARENGSNGTPERLYAEVQVKQAGYIYIYLSNDNYEMRGEPVDVFFDDFGIQQVHSKLVQSDDYYPFGLTFNSYSRENSTPQDFKFNGKEVQDELGLNWLDHGARMYQPEIARWMVVDPLADKYTAWSAYSFSFNNPILFWDPTGMEGIVVSGQPGDHDNEKHFLVNGLDRAKKLQKKYDKAGKGEKATWIVYNNGDPEKGGYSAEVMDEYKKQAEKAGIELKVVSSSDEIVDYVNEKTGDDSRSKDQISDFVYVGHALPGELSVGYESHNWFDELTHDALDPADFKKEAFKDDANANLVGGCRTCVPSTFGKSAAEKMSEKVGGEVRGSNVRVYYPGGPVSDEVLVKKNGGQIIVIPAKGKGKKTN